MNLDIAIIVLNYNNYKMTKENVDNLINLNIESPIVIVDNNSPNDSYEILKEYYKNSGNVKVITNYENRGYSSGNNFGIRYINENIKGIEYICIMNPDVKITYKEIFTNLVKKIESNKKIALIGAMMIKNNVLDTKNTCWKIPRGKDILCNSFRLLNRFKGQNKEEKLEIEENDSLIAKVDVIPGSFFIIKNTVLSEIGLLDENTFLYNEENILAIELKRRGYDEYLSINDYYFHNHKKGNLKLKEKININRFSFQSKKYLCKKYYNKKILVILYIIFFLNSIDIYIVQILKAIGRLA